MKKNYRVSIDGMSVYYETKEEAIAFAETENAKDPDRRIQVFSAKFNNVIFEN